MNELLFSKHDNVEWKHHNLMLHKKTNNFKTKMCCWIVFKTEKGLLILILKYKQIAIIMFDALIYKILIKYNGWTPAEQPYLLYLHTKQYFCFVCKDKVSTPYYCPLPRIVHDRK